MTPSRASLVPLYFVLACVAVASGAACVQVLGITQGLPLVDAGGASDTGVPHDAGAADAGHDAMTHDARTVRDAPADVVHDAACVTLANFCDHRCGQAVDNCDRPITSGGCEGGASCTRATARPKRSARRARGARAAR